jgi:hypothetical protein
VAAISTIVALSALAAGAFEAKAAASAKGPAAPPPVAAPPAPDPAAESKARQDAAGRLKKKGPISAFSGSTLLTGPSGSKSAATVATKTLLGQ